MCMAISKRLAEDPLHVNTDPGTGQTSSGPAWAMLHLELIVDRMMREFGVAANVGKPQVAYRETIRNIAIVDYTPQQQPAAGASTRAQAGVWSRIRARVTSRPRSPLAATSPRNLSRRWKGVVAAPGRRHFGRPPEVE